MHPTRICMKRFLKPQESELTPHLTDDDDSTGSDTLCDSEESEEDEIKPTTDVSIQPAKVVTFDLTTEESIRKDTQCQNDESEGDDDSDDDNTDT